MRRLPGEFAEQRCVTEAISIVRFVGMSDLCLAQRHRVLKMTRCALRIRVATEQQQPE